MNSPLAPGVTFTPVDSALIRIKLSLSLIWGLIFLVAAGVATFMTWETTPWVGLSVVFVLVIWIWYAVLVGRRVHAMGYAELEEELLLCKGILFRSLEVIPYGRMQQVEVAAGPMLKRFGLASVNLVTASASSNGGIPAVPAAEAERLRTKLTALGTAEMEGL